MPEKMEIKLYRESINRKTGKGVGDDALPYIGDRLMSVADGAGGRAYALQPDINPLLTDSEVSFETAVAGIIPPDDIRRDLYKQQYMENFFNEGFSLSADYAESGGRKSSYFGSRLASILIRRLIDMYLPEEELESFFNDLHERPEDEREKVLRELGDGFARELYAQMQQAADNCHLAFGETVSVTNVNLMSTTYSGLASLCPCYGQAKGRRRSETAAEGTGEGRRRHDELCVRRRTVPSSAQLPPDSETVRADVRDRRLL